MKELSNIGLHLLWYAEEKKPGEWSNKKGSISTSPLKQLTLLIDETSLHSTFKWLTTDQFKSLFDNEVVIPSKATQILMIRLLSIYGFPMVLFVYPMNSDIYNQGIINRTNTGKWISRQCANALNSKELSQKISQDQAQWSKLVSNLSNQVMTTRQSILKSNMSSIKSALKTSGIDSLPFSLDDIPELNLHPLTFDQLEALIKTLTYHRKAGISRLITREVVAKSFQEVESPVLPNTKSTPAAANIKTFTPEEMLHRYEEAAKIALEKHQKVIGKLVGVYCVPPISNAAITDYIKKHKTALTAALREQPNEWSVIRGHFKSIQKLIGS